ncbi:MAG: RNase adapter RapZ [Porticoccaceae bacterium]|nr:RNase adapter RapZ [Pseudomonadales bacterium]MCP5172605.1 RNase adapter RapZ [Pseudomonadales bacterium]MCP5303521.1 RNase adapter RapZ [Pseudomonadales bacterium]
MRLVIISGRSGSGKSTALNVLEDVGFTCIDNLPASLLPNLIQQTVNDKKQIWPNKIAVGIDARNVLGNLGDLPAIIKQLQLDGIHSEIIFLDARSPVIIQRFSETRRKHPLSSGTVDLKEAIKLESKMLEPLADIATRKIDTSTLTLHQLRDIIKKHIAPDTQGELAVLFESFGFKRGVPVDADFVFDVRCLPNPYWKPELRGYSGNDQPVIEFLETQPDVAHMLADINGYLSRWIPQFQASNRSYLTIAIGCTGGQHRSVYIANQLGKFFSNRLPNIQVRHRELS